MPRRIVGRRLKGVPPLKRHEREYERAIRRQLLLPMVAPFVQALDFAESRYLEIRARLDAIPVPPFPVGPVTAQVAARAGVMRSYQKRAFERVMNRALGVDVGPLSLGPNIAARTTTWIGTNVDLIKTIPPRFHFAMKRDLLKLAGGAAFDRQALAQIVSKNYGSAGYNLRRITRDQTQKLIAQLNQQRQADVGVTHYIWRTSEDERVRPSHRRNNGNEFAWAQPPVQTGHPGNDIQCVPGWVRVLPAELHTSVAYRYVGELIEIGFAQGIDLTVSPNHPVLTKAGWVPAGTVEVGDELVEHGIRRGLETSDPKVTHGNPCAAQLHGLSGGILPEAGAASRRVDLHRDSATIQAVADEEVEVVSVPRRLLDELDTPASEFFGNLDFEPADTATGHLVRPGDLPQSGREFAGVPTGSIGRASEGTALTGAGLSHSETVGFGSRSERQPDISEAGLDHRAADPEIVGNLFHRLLSLPPRAHFGEKGAAAFSMARVVRVTRRSYSGPLYSFGTHSGILLCNGIVTHNCRCTADPILVRPRVRRVIARRR